MKPSMRWKRVRQPSTKARRGSKGTVVFAVTGDMMFLPVFEAKDKLEADGYKVRIVAIVNPRRLYRPD